MKFLLIIANTDGLNELQINLFEDNNIILIHDKIEFFELSDFSRGPDISSGILILNDSIYGHSTIISKIIASEIYIVYHAGEGGDMYNKWRYRIENEYKGKIVKYIKESHKANSFYSFLDKIIDRSLKIDDIIEKFFTKKESNKAKIQFLKKALKQDRDLKDFITETEIIQEQESNLIPYINTFLNSDRTEKNLVELKNAIL